MCFKNETKEGQQRVPWYRRWFKKEEVVEETEEEREKRLWEEKLNEMDEQWRRSGMSSWSLFPPSYQYRYTEEELEEMRKKEMEEIYKLIDQLE